MAFLIMSLVLLAITNTQIGARPSPIPFKDCEERTKCYKLPTKLLSLEEMVISATMYPDQDTIQVILPARCNDESTCTITYQKEMDATDKKETTQTNIDATSIIIIIKEAKTESGHFLKFFINQKLFTYDLGDHDEEIRYIIMKKGVERINEMKFHFPE